MPASHELVRCGQRRALRITAVTCAMVFAVVSVAAAHDMFAKPDRFFVAENATVLIRILNGTFSKSENSIARPRVQDVSVVSPSGRAHLDTSAWSTNGDTSTFTVHTGESGTYVIGASTRPNVIPLKAADFNLYLRDDGIPDVLATRERNGELDKPVRERYHKHIKALIQVGTKRSEHFATALGYPAEIIPIQNPYVLSRDQTLSVRTLVDGAPATNQYVQYGGRTPAGKRIAQKSVRSDGSGIARIRLAASGTWYVKFISMTPIQGDTVEYESKWATLTFRVQ